MELTLTTPDGKAFKSVKVARTVKNINGNIDRGLVSAAIFLVAQIKSKYLSGQVLNVRTGRLRNSITHSNPERGPAGPFIKVGTNVKYAKVHEYGAKIEPKTSKVLRFNIPGVGWRSAHQVTIPPRPFMKPALKDNSAEIVRKIKKHITREWRR